MIHPSYVDLMQVVNANAGEGEEPVISSRYSIVMATARRARQLVAGDDPLVDTRNYQKPLSIAVEELNENKVHILTEADKIRMQEEIAASLEALKEGEAAGENAVAEEEAVAEPVEAPADEADEAPDDEDAEDA